MSIELYQGANYLSPKFTLPRKQIELLPWGVHLQITSSPWFRPQNFEFLPWGVHLNPYAPGYACAKFPTL